MGLLDSLKSLFGSSNNDSGVTADNAQACPQCGSTTGCEHMNQGSPEMDEAPSMDAGSDDGSNMESTEQTTE